MDAVRVRPTFPPVFVEQARALVGCRKVERRQWQRAQLVLLLHENPDIPHPVSAQAVGLSDQWVRNWRYSRNGGVFSFEDRPHPGRLLRPGWEQGLPATTTDRHDGGLPPRLVALIG